MQIVIPTYGRTSSQITWGGLPDSVRARTVLLVQQSEWDSFWKDNQTEYPNVKALHSGIKSIGPTRQYILENFGPKVLMMDDDFEFATRRADDPTKFSPSTPKQIEEMVKGIEDELDRVSVVGLSQRGGANRRSGKRDVNTRITGVTGLRTDVVRGNGVRYDRIPVMEDFDVTLQMLRLGYRNVCLNQWVYNQKGSGTSGGCSSHRTMEVQASSAKMLAALHHPFVKVVKKTTKTSWGGRERTDVRIYWKKAFAPRGL